MSFTFQCFYISKSTENNSNATTSTSNFIWATQCIILLSYTFFFWLTRVNWQKGSQMKGNETKGWHQRMIFKIRSLHFLNTFFLITVFINDEMIMIDLFLPNQCSLWWILVCTFNPCMESFTSSTKYGLKIKQMIIKTNKFQAQKHSKAKETQMFNHLFR